MAKLMTSTDVGRELGIGHMCAAKVMDRPEFPAFRCGPMGTRYVKDTKFRAWLHGPDGQKWLQERREWLISRDRGL